MDTKHKDLMNDEVTRILERMRELNVDSDEYKKLLKSLEGLESVKNKSHMKLSPDAILNAGVSILSVLLVLNFEKLGVITSKAFRLPRS